jgi:hypothetical protein
MLPPPPVIKSRRRQSEFPRGPATLSIFNNTAAVDLIRHSSLQGFKEDGSQFGATDLYHKVSEPLVKAVTEAARARTSLQVYNRIASSLVLTLISIPVWLIIILLSPLDAYAAARDTASHLVRH